MKIDVTQEMIDAFNHADFSEAGVADWEDEHVRIGLAAVLEHIPDPIFVINDETIKPFSHGAWWADPVQQLRAAAEAAGFRVEDRTGR